MKKEKNKKNKEIKGKKNSLLNSSCQCVKTRHVLFPFFCQKKKKKEKQREKWRQRQWWMN